jgi:D-glycero-beta-D-manno-heptose 1-phosphate adenylyltransferase
MEKNWEQESLKKVIEPNKLEDFVANLRKKHKSIVTLNGSFDLLHAGHLYIIYEASLQGDVLIVALNTDESIRQYKGPTRPIIPLKYRLQMMAALFFVDFVTYFDELDPRAILEKIKPDVHVNGSEYGENCIEADVVRAHGGRLHLVKRVEGLSSSYIIEKIKKCEK